jgi:hypothetical protein
MKIGPRANAQQVLRLFISGSKTPSYHENSGDQPTDRADPHRRGDYLDTIDKASARRQNFLIESPSTPAHPKIVIARRQKDVLEFSRAVTGASRESGTSE